MSPLREKNCEVKVLCMNIYVWNAIKNYENMPINVMIKSNIKIFLKQPWSPPLIPEVITDNTPVDVCM